jgi:hypothetical protein
MPALHASVFVSISPCATYCLSLCLARRLGHNGNAHFMRVIHRDISRRDISETVSRPSQHHAGRRRFASGIQSRHQSLVRSSRRRNHANAWSYKSMGTSARERDTRHSVQRIDSPDSDSNRGKSPRRSSTPRSARSSWRLSDLGGLPGQSTSARKKRSAGPFA